MSTFKNALAASVGTSDVSILTAGTASTLIGLSIANITASSITASVKVTSGATTAYIIKNAVIPVGQSLVPLGGDQKVVLETGDILKISTSVAAGADAVLSYIEV